MKTRECDKASADCPMYRLGKHWNTIQAYLIPGIEDDIGARFVNLVPAEARATAFTCP